jgi:hypothetical protein
MPTPASAATSRIVGRPGLLSSPQTLADIVISSSRIVT